KKAIHGDGLSFYSELMDSKPGEEHDFVVFSSFEGPTLITKEGWKIRTVVKKHSFELYNLNEDFREENNLDEKYPDKLKQLKLMLLNACEGDLNNGLYSTQQSQMDI
ncbi:MAG: sulfatase, partial [Bacteroidales bacterium]|nr:sulfatase [Bacteroidales bacterium]